MPRSLKPRTSNGKSASNSRNSRSLPGLPVAMTSGLRRASLRGACTELSGMQPGDTLCREVQQLIEFVAAKRVSFGGALDLDERAAAVHHHIHIRFRVRILRVVQIEHRRAAVDSYRDG